MTSNGPLGPDWPSNDPPMITPLWVNDPQVTWVTPKWPTINSTCLPNAPLLLLQKKVCIMSSLEYIHLLILDQHRLAANCQCYFITCPAFSQYQLSSSQCHIMITLFLLWWISASSIVGLATWKTTQTERCDSVPFDPTNPQPRQQLHI